MTSQRDGRARALVACSMLAAASALMQGSDGVAGLAGGPSGQASGAAAVTLLAPRSQPAGRRSADPANTLRVRYAAPRLDVVARALAAGPGSRLSLNLFDDLTLDGVAVAVERTASGGLAWHGRLASDPASTVTLVVNGAVMIGEVRRPGALYEIRLAGAGLTHVVRQLDPSAFPPELEPLEPAIDPVAVARADRRPRTDDGSTLDVLVVYTPAARIDAGGQTAIESVIDLAIANANTAYANSGVIQRLNLVGTQEVAYTESGSFSTDLVRLTETSDGFIDAVHATRDALNADFVAMVIHDTGLCGIAWLMNVNSTAFAANAFSVNEHSCIAGNLTLAHELGHNQSLRHDTSSSGGLAVYGRGYNDSTQRTVMAVSSGQPRRQHLSNPDVAFTTGSMGPSGTAVNDSARALDETRVVAANFRDSTAGGHTLTTQGAGSGTGTITSGTTIACTSTAGVASGDCSEGAVASGTTFALTATAASGSAATTWAGCDAANGATCTVTLTADRTVTATFEALPPPGPPAPPAATQGVQASRRLALDLSGSGRSATIVYDAAGGGATVYAEPGGASSGPGRALAAVASHGWSPGWTIEAGDFDGDGRTDLLFYDAATGQVFKGFSDGAYGFSYVATSWSPGWAVAVMELNGDGLADLFLYNATTGAWYRAVGTGDGRGDFAYTAGQWSPGWLVVPLELDGDGRTDVLVYNATSGAYYRLVSTGTGFAVAGSGTWSPGWELTPGRFDGDGRDDVFFYARATGAYFVGRNTGGGFSYTGGTLAAGRTVRGGDFGGDGLTDLFLYDHATGVYTVAEADGAGGLQQTSGVVSPGWTTAVTEYDGDGRADLLFYNATSGAYFQARPTGPGTFAYVGGGFAAGGTLVTNRP